MPKFTVASPYQPAGDQPYAIDALSKSINAGNQYQTLLGVTGSGKTYTMAKVIEKTGKATLIMTHNKTLAAQLYSEFKAFFPNNHVEYFISYYDYYQPEAYLPRQDLFIEILIFYSGRARPGVPAAHILTLLRDTLIGGPQSWWTMCDNMAPCYFPRPSSSLTTTVGKDDTDS